MALKRHTRKRNAAPTPERIEAVVRRLEIGLPMQVGNWSPNDIATAVIWTLKFGAEGAKQRARLAGWKRIPDTTTLHFWCAQHKALQSNALEELSRFAAARTLELFCNMVQNIQQALPTMAPELQLEALDKVASTVEKLQPRTDNPQSDIVINAAIQNNGIGGVKNPATMDVQAAVKSTLPALPSPESRKQIDALVFEDDIVLDEDYPDTVDLSLVKKTA